MDDKQVAERMDRTARLIMGDAGHEIRIVEATGKVTNRLASSPQQAVDIATAYDGRGEVYISLNAAEEIPLTDEGVKCRKWIGVDLDLRVPRRAVERTAWGLHTLLSGVHGFPTPVVAYSGRGAWLLYRTDLSNTSQVRRSLQRWLNMLAELEPSVDTTSYNASRVMRFFGTLNTKGSRSEIISVPDPLEVLTLDKIEAMVGPEERRERKARPVQDASNPRSLSGMADSYGAAGIASRLDELIQTPEGHRNEILAKTCRRFSELVAEGHLDYEFGLSELWRVAEEIGLTDGQELSSTRRTIDANYVRRVGGDMVHDREPGATALASVVKLDGPGEPILPGVLSPPTAGGATPDLYTGWDDWTESVPEPVWLLRADDGTGLVAPGTLVWAYGEKEVGKSYFLLYLGKQLGATGKRTIYYSEEMDRATDKLRLAKLGIPPRSFLFWRNGTGLNLALRGTVEDVIAEIRDVGASLVIFDSYEKVWQTATTNENRRAVEFATVAKRIILATGATIVVIDHTGFPTRDKDGNLHRERKPRGASSKEQQADMSILFENLGVWTGVGHDFRFTVTNMKPGRLMNPFKKTFAMRDTPDGKLVIVEV